MTEPLHRYETLLQKHNQQRIYDDYAYYAQSTIHLLCDNEVLASKTIFTPQYENMQIDELELNVNWDINKSKAIKVTKFFDMTARKLRKRLNKIRPVNGTYKFAINRTIENETK